MIQRTGIIALLFALFFSGCSPTKSVVWTSQDVSLTVFKSFQILPVFNATGKSVNKDLLSFLTAALKEQFEVQNLKLTHAEQTQNGVLIVQSDLAVYTTTKQLSGKFISIGTRGNPRIAQCIINTRLVNKLTSDVVARISTDYRIGYQVPENKLNELIMRKSASAVAKEVAKIMQPKESERGISVWQQL